jgi:hypothetical protein
LAEREDLAQRLGEELPPEGLTLTKPCVTPRGEVVGVERYDHPAVKMLRENDKVVLALRAQLGLDPGSRARLGLDVLALDETPNRLAELHERRRKRLAKQKAARAATSNGKGSS